MNLLNNKKINDYVDKVCSNVKNKHVHEDVKLELVHHIEESIIENSDTDTIDLSNTKIIDKAIEKMGDADIIGKQLDVVHRKKTLWSTIIISFILSVFGIVLMYLLGSKSNFNESNLATKSIISFMVGIVAFCMFYFVDYRRLINFSKYIYLGNAVMSIAVFIFGNQLNGEKMNIAFSGMNINFAYVSAFVFIISLAGLYYKYKWNQKVDCIIGIAIGILPIVIFMLSGSLASIIIYFTAFLTLLFTTKMSTKYILIINSIVFAIICFNFKDRFYYFINASIFQQSQGWRYLKIKEALLSGGLMGNGVNTKFDIPASHTDYILTYMIYVWGWIFGIILITLAAFFVYKLVKAVNVVQNPYGKVLMSALLAIIASRFLICILSNLSLLPFLNIGFPFLSFGNMNHIMDLAMIGMISSVYKIRTVKAIEV